MPRRRPRRLRVVTPTTRPTTARGLPTATAAALDRLGVDELSSTAVALALAEWARVVAQPEAVLRAPHNDWTEFVGPAARSTLEDAVRSLPRLSAEPLRAELARLDARFDSKTSNNPFADPSLPWWARRWWH